MTFARRYRESLSTQTVLEAASLFDILADAGMLVLHSAYIITRQGQGILFSGPSGIGKSTQAALWQRYAGAEIVNGDRALVRPDTGTVSGVFYAGTSGISGTSRLRCRRWSCWSREAKIGLLRCDRRRPLPGC